MLFRLQHYNEVDLYRYYNLDHPGWPNNLPPPPNPTKFRTLIVWILNRSIEMQNEENDPKNAQATQAQQGQRRRMTP